MIHIHAHTYTQRQSEFKSLVAILVINIIKISRPGRNICGNFEVDIVHVTGML